MKKKQNYLVKYLRNQGLIYGVVGIVCYCLTIWNIKEPVPDDASTGYYLVRLAIWVSSVVFPTLLFNAGEKLKLSKVAEKLLEDNKKNTQQEDVEEFIEGLK